jgi:hypothetical protein
LAGRRTIRQTTLAGGWWWAGAALASWSLAEAAAALQSPPAAAWLEALRFAAISLSLCPMIAVLGAKRPQHGAWNFVVLSLFAIVALPAAEFLVLRPGQRLVVGDARAWFLWVLLILGPVNYLATRYGFAALLACGGQVVALSPYLALIRKPLIADAGVAGLVLCVGALLAVWVAATRAERASRPLDRVWLDFRDSFGLFWGLRVQERINATAQQSGWRLELTWRGFAWHTNGTNPAKIEPAVEPAVRSTLKGLLRRFVSNEWIAERSGTPID